MSLVAALRISRAPALAFAAMGGLWGAFAALVPQIKGALALGDAAFGAAVLFSALGLVTSMWLAPLAEARLGRAALPLAVALLALAFVLPGQATGWAGLAASMLVMGGGSGLCDVVMNARVSALEARHRRALMNLNHALFSLAYALGAVYAGAGREAGWPPAPIFALLTAAGLLATVGMWDAPETADDGGAGGPEGAFPVGVVAWGGALVLVAFLAENACEGWSALHIERTLGGGAVEGALGPAMLGLTMFVGRMSGQIVAGHWSEARVIFWAGLLAAAGAALAAAASGLVAAYLGFALLGLGISVLAPMALALVGQRVSDRDRTRAISRAAVIGFLGFFFGPAAMGGLAETLGLRWAFAAIALLLCGTPLLLRGLAAASRR